MTTRIFILFFICFSIGFSQNTHTLSGIVYEKEGQETLIGANIIIPALNTGTTTNEYGFYSITLEAGTYEVLISYIGFDTQRAVVTLSQNISQNFSIVESTDQLDEVVLETNVERVNIKSPQMSVNALTANSIKQIPVVFGEADVIKAITLLPGVSNGGEGSGGFNVRGGSTDQNLILLEIYPLP